MKELIANLHVHTVYSDGNETHQQIASSAHKAGIDILIFTDHNVLVGGTEGFLVEKGHRLLMLVGEELHDPTRLPQKSHLLVFGHRKELATYTRDTQSLIDQATKNGGISFIAHPYENDLPVFGEPDITWEDWQTTGYTGMEIWNGLSELKDVVHNYFDGFFHTLFPQYIHSGPREQALRKWDELMAGGRKVVAIGGSDAHALKFQLGPIKRTIFPYEFHFNAINTHLFTSNELSGDLVSDKKMVIDAFKKGHCFVANDLPASTKGFRFVAQGKVKTALMGDTIALGSGITFQIRLPLRTRCYLIKDGNRIKGWGNKEIITQFVDKPGIYRIESYINYLGKWRGWIFSNPIYVKENPNKLFV